MGVGAILARKPAVALWAARSRPASAGAPGAPSRANLSLGGAGAKDGAAAALGAGSHVVARLAPSDDVKAKALEAVKLEAVRSAAGGPRKWVKPVSVPAGDHWFSV